MAEVLANAPRDPLSALLTAVAIAWAIPCLSVWVPALIRRLR